MAQSKKSVVTFKDFTGGLNLSAQRQDLLLNESPDCLDVDFDKRGGFTLRRGVRNVVLDANMTGGYLLGSFSFGTDLLAGVSNVGRLWTWDGATATHVATAITSNVTTESVRAIPWTNKLYFANCYNGGSTLVMRYWNGAAFTTLGNTANNNYTAPVGGQAPLSRLITDHAGFMWWADTVEGGTRFRSRIRFSHYLQPEDWAQADFYDIDPDDQTDQITALVPFKNMLLVFKRRSVWGVYGTTRDDFVVERVSAAAGVWTQEGVTVNQGVAFWWSPDGNVYSFDGSQTVAIGDRLSQLLFDGVVLPGADHRLCWAENRLYLSLVKPDTTRLTFVYDPEVGKRGAWTKYSVSVSSMVWWRRVSGVNGIMMTLSGKSGVYDFNIAAQEQDFDGTTSTSIAGYYITAWYSADDPALLKRFRRMHLTCACKDDAQMNIQVFYDFNENTVGRTLTVQMQAVAGGMLWNQNWGGIWGGIEPVYVFDRLTSAGRGHAIKFKFFVTNHATKWWVDSFALPYYEKGYR